MPVVASPSNHDLNFILREANYASQSHLDAVVLLLLLSGSARRFLFGWSADRFCKRPVLTVAFALIAGSMPFLLVLDWAPARLPYLFAFIFGLGMSVDSLMLPMVATDHFGTRSLAPVLGIIEPVNVVGQTWFPSLLSLLCSATGSYTVPLLLTVAFFLTGPFFLAATPPPEKDPHPSVKTTPVPVSR